MECEHFAPKSWSRERRQQVASDANILASLSHRVVWGLWDGEARLSIWELYWADERLSWLLWQILRWEAIYGSVGAEMHQSEVLGVQQLPSQERGAEGVALGMVTGELRSSGGQVSPCLFNSITKSAFLHIIS